MKKSRLLTTFIAITVFAGAFALTSTAAQAAGPGVVPPVGSTCKDAIDAMKICTFPDGSRWICTDDLKQCKRKKVKPSTSFPTKRPLGMAPEKPGNGQPPVGRSNLIEKRQPRKGGQTPVGTIKAPQGVPEGVTIQGNRVLIKKGFTVERVSDTQAVIMKKGKETGTVTCDPCSGKGSCTLSSSGGKLGCTSTCDQGCITIITIPIPKMMRR